MIDYRFQGRLRYINGGGMNVQMSAWPAAGGNWWEPTTGTFTCVGAYQAKGAASLAASYVNLADPGTYDLAEGVAPTFDTSTGWTFNGSTQYLDTGIVPTATTWTYIGRFSNASSATQGQFLGRWSTSGVILSTYGPGNIQFRNFSGQVNVASVGQAGVMAMADRDCYFDGSDVGANLGTGTYDADVSLFIGAMNRPPLGGAVSFFTGKVQAIAVYSTTLDPTQVAEISANMAAL